jgi:hypothetical protein
MHNEELHNLYSSPIIIRMIKSRGKKWEGNVSHMWSKRNAYRILVEKQEEKTPLRGPLHRWENIIKMDLREIRMGWNGLD